MLTTQFPTVALLLAIVACAPTDPDASIVRGRGLQPAKLPPTAEARVYEGAVRAAFDVGPGLTLLIHPRRLPRTTGYDSGDAVPPGLVSALRERGVVQGTCDPIRDAPKSTPRCSIREPGYVVRASDVLRVAPDTVELYFSAEQFAAATGKRAESLRFEKVYQLVGSGTTWRVAREGRSPEGSR